MTVKFYLAPSKVKDKEVAIVAVITKSRKERFWITLDEKVKPKHWDERTQRVKTSDEANEAKNDYLDDFRRNTNNLYRSNRNKSISELKALVRGGAVGDEKKTLRHCIDAFIGQYEQEKDRKTIRRYKAVKNHLFGQLCKDGSPKSIYYEDLHGPVDFAQLDWNFYDAFRSMLYKKGMVDSSVNKYVGSLQTILRWGRKRIYPVDPVFEEWPLTKRVNKPLSIDITELILLENAMNLTPEQAIGRDFFCFEARTGQRISDIIRFSKSQYNPLTKEWTFNMKKGFNIKPKVQTVIFEGFCEKGLRILERNDFQWPKVPQYRINQWIRQAAEAVGLTELVEVRTWKRNKCEITYQRKCDLMSTHVGRKSFATILIPLIGKDEVKAMMGVDSDETMKHYQGPADQNMRRKKLVDADKELRALIEMETKLKAG